ncbi:hypothetical protein [Streptomyces sp. 184]|uniref:hypothetical protein n=1 Tax=Streptomyces sp. 184 TaxID=1827526 RepID=UPI00389297E6
MSRPRTAPGRARSCARAPRGPGPYAATALGPVPQPLTRTATACALAAWTAVTALLLHHRATAPARMAVRP